MGDTMCDTMATPLPIDLHSRGTELIVIGGSAGAIEVLQTMVRGLSTSFAPAMVVIVHLPPDARGVLHEVLGGAERPPMKVAEDKEPIVPGNVYFATPGYHLLVEGDRTFALSLDEPVHFSRPSIDVLLESAAEVYRERMMGVILSGANPDGAAGLKAVADAGGTTVVQLPASAEVPAMPEAALRACPRSVVADVAGLTALLAGFSSG